VSDVSDVTDTPRDDAIQSLLDPLDLEQLAHEIRQHTGREIIVRLIPEPAGAPEGGAPARVSIPTDGDAVGGKPVAASNGESWLSPLHPVDIPSLVEEAFDEELLRAPPPEAAEAEEEEDDDIPVDIDLDEDVAAVQGAEEPDEPDAEVGIEAPIRSATRSGTIEAPDTPAPAAADPALRVSFDAEPAATPPPVPKEATAGETSKETGDEALETSKETGDEAIHDLSAEAEVEAAGPPPVPASDAGGDITADAAQDGVEPSGEAADPEAFDEGDTTEVEAQGPAPATGPPPPPGEATSSEASTEAITEAITEATAEAPAPDSQEGEAQEVFEPEPAPASAEPPPPPGGAEPAEAGTEEPEAAAAVPPPPPAEAQAKEAAKPPPPPEASVKAEGVAEQPPPPPAEAREGKKKRKKRFKKPWFEEFFDDDYLRTLPYMTDAMTAKESKFIEEHLSLQPKQTVLDIGCGYGRHAIQLAKQGYEVTGIDTSLPLLIKAAEFTREVGTEVNFMHQDMREMTFEDEFDGAYCVMTSFGYFDDDSNRDVLQRIFRAVRPGGRFLLEAINRDFILRDLPSRVWWEGDDCVVMDEVEFNFLSSRVVSKRSVVFSDGRSINHDLSIRAYCLHELGRLLHSCGFKVRSITGNHSTESRFFGTDSPYLIILSEKN